MGESTVFQLVDVHFIVMGSGPIWSNAWGKQHIACMPQRDCLAAHEADEFSASDMPEAVTCPACKSTPAYRGMVKALFPHLLIQEQLREAQGLNRWKKSG